MSRQAWAAAVVAILALLTTSARATGDSQTLQVGSVVLHRCETPAGWCGYLRRPLDSSGAVPGSLAIYFEYYPHAAAAAAAGTLVATEGGPGYPATRSRNEYLQLFAPLRSRRDVLLMDNRGTGRSAAIDCVALQSDPAITEANVAQCGRFLGAQAASYSTASASDDLAAILDALGVRRIDLYGDSYGTFFAQTFAVRHPDRLRSLVLDGAYPLSSPGYAWYPNYAPAMRAKFDRACARSPSCAHLGGASLEHIAPVVAALRNAPFTAQAADADGNVRQFTANASQLATVMFGSAPAYASVRELDAAARAFMQADRAPLLRLMAETSAAVDSRDVTKAPQLFSSGLAAAVTCHDAPQIFDMTVPPAQRRVQRDRELAQRRAQAPDTYAPFTIDEYRGMPLDYAFLDECVGWPAEARAAALPRYPDIPVLVISGDLDNMTPVADGALATRDFPRGRQLIVLNGLHVNALPHSRSACPAQIVRRFLATLDPGDTRCLEAVPELRLLPQFARRTSALAPAAARAGNAADPAHLRAVTAAVLTVADVIDRIESNTSGTGVGLRGGTFHLEAYAVGYRLKLQEIRWTEDLRVSGTVIWPGREGNARADLQITGSAAMAGPLQLTWEEGVAQARVRIRGTLGKQVVSAETTAP
ncbi:MAG TPA: alpha/beta fold hydrolase [Steroidobacteraceae bacterium]